MKDKDIIQGLEMLGNRIDNLVNLIRIQKLRIDLLENSPQWVNKVGEKGDNPPSHGNSYEKAESSEIAGTPVQPEDTNSPQNHKARLSQRVSAEGDTLK